MKQSYECCVGGGNNGGGGGGGGGSCGSPGGGTRPTYLGPAVPYVSPVGHPPVALFPPPSVRLGPGGPSFSPPSAGPAVIVPKPPVAGIPKPVPVPSSNTGQFGCAVQLISSKPGPTPQVVGLRITCRETGVTQAIPSCSSTLPTFYNNYSFGSTLHFDVQGGEGTWCSDGQQHSYAAASGSGVNAGEKSITVTQLD